MKQRMPPLIALRVFEAVARNLSFTKAAEELHVTQAAVSHQVRKLEEWLQVTLFLRMNRSIKLTKEGEAYAQPLSEAFKIIADATGHVLGEDASKSLNIATYDSIATKWLAPRIKAYQASVPDIPMTLFTHSSYSDFKSGEIDVEIRYGDGNWPDLSVEKIADEFIFPVCSPSLLEEDSPLSSVNDVKNFELIHDRMVIGWPNWLEEAGGDPEGTKKGMHYNHSHLVFQSAIAGHGFALGRSLLVANDLAEKRLIAPFKTMLKSNFSYYLVCPKDLSEKPWIRSFYDWLADQAAQTSDVFEEVVANTA